MLDDTHETKLRALLEALIDQRAARVLVPPHQAAPGFWFGGGNLIKGRDGTLWLAGRYRDAGDSTRGLEAGVRGRELAVFQSKDGGTTFEKVHGWPKASLRCAGNEVLSIEGAALHLSATGEYELFVSTEKQSEYPPKVREYQKPGTGVWSIDRMAGDSIQNLDPHAIAPVFTAKPAPEYLHVKDPVVFDAAEGDTVLVFCTHPFAWTSSNSAYAVRPKASDAFELRSWEMVSRGPAWDVAGTRITNRMPVPRAGVFAGLPPVSIYFYDGLECVRQLDQNPRGVKRPRGYSCEELGGALWGLDEAFPSMTRLSTLAPLFVSPYGTGCSRYVDTLVDETGIFATWQQGQDDGSQPLVGHKLTMDEVARILS